MGKLQSEEEITYQYQMQKVNNQEKVHNNCRCPKLQTAAKSTPESRNGNFFIVSQKSWIL